MTNQEFEKYIQENISPDLYIEKLEQFTDIDRIVLKLPNGRTAAACAIPKDGLREEFDPNYKSVNDQAFPNRETVIARVTNFVNKMKDPENLDLYKKSYEEERAGK